MTITVFESSFSPLEPGNFLLLANLGLEYSLFTIHLSAKQESASQICKTFPDSFNYTGEGSIPSLVLLSLQTHDLISSASPFSQLSKSGSRSMVYRGGEQGTGTRIACIAYIILSRLRLCSVNWLFQIMLK